MNRIVKKSLEFLLVLLTNLFFLWVVRQMPVYDYTAVDALASSLSISAPTAPYVQQVDTARALLRQYREEQVPLTAPGLFAIISSRTSRAAEEALQLEGFPKSMRIQIKPSA